MCDQHRDWLLRTLIDPREPTVQIPLSHSRLHVIPCHTIVITLFFIRDISPIHRFCGDFGNRNTPGCMYCGESCFTVLHHTFSNQIQPNIEGSIRQACINSREALFSMTNSFSAKVVPTVTVLSNLKHLTRSPNQFEFQITQLSSKMRAVVCEIEEVVLLQVPPHHLFTFWAGAC